jgi:hypothetical protein
VAIAEAMADNVSDADADTLACSCAVADADALAVRFAAAMTDNKPDGSDSEKSGTSNSAANDDALLVQKQLMRDSPTEEVDLLARLCVAPGWPWEG